MGAIRTVVAVLDNTWLKAEDLGDAGFVVDEALLAFRASRLDGKVEVGRSVTYVGAAALNN